MVKRRFIAGSIAALMLSSQMLMPIDCKASQLSESETVVVQEQEVEPVEAPETSVQGEERESDNLTGKVIAIDKFGLYGNSKLDAYAAEYRVGITAIKTNNNNGCYGSSVISNAIDNDYNTYWETNKPNSSSFTNEVELTLANVTEVGSVVYSARKDGAAGKGFPTKVSVYGAVTQNDYSLIGSGTYSGAVTDVIEIIFEKTSVKYIKFVFDNANQGYASAAEFQVFKEDKVRRAIKNLFTDGTYTEVAKEYATLAKLYELKTLLKNHPLKDEYNPDIDLAIKILNMGIDTKDRIFTANQYGNVANHSKNDLKFNYGAASNYQSTGIASLAGETITVYVDVENEKYMPQLIFTQFDGDNSGWWQYVSLKKGKNVITTPFQTYSLGWSENWEEPVNAGGAIYICNPYTAEQQGRAPKIRIEGGTDFPLLKLDSNSDDFISELKTYMDKVKADAAETPNIINRKMFDIFEFEIDHMIFTGTASGAYDAFVTNGRNPHEVLQSWDTFLNRIFEFVGLDGKDENGNYNIYDDGTHVKQHIFVAQHVGWMVACANHIGIWTSQVSGLLNTFEAAKGNWGIAHEIGHTMDIGSRTYKESTNNMLALYTAAVYGQGYFENNVPYEGFTYKSTLSDNPVSYSSQDFFQRMGVFWQLELYHPGYWGELNSAYRKSCPNYSSVATGDEEIAKEQAIIKYSCEVLKLDLCDHFYRHGFTVTDETRQAMNKYPKCDKLWYLNGGSYKYTGDGLNSLSKVSISTKVDEANSKITVNMNIGNEDKSDILGYEISRDGKIIGFTGKSSFADSSVDVTKNHTYSVVAYGYDLSKAKAVTIDSFAPSIKLDENVIVELNDKFSPLEYVSATDFRGNKITDIAVSGSVNTKVKGKSTITYSVTSDGKTVSRKMNVEVVSEKYPITSYDWESISVGYGTPRKNQNISVNLYGTKKSFDTGLYMHAPAEVVYDLTEIQKLNYDRFEAWAGIDQSITEQSNSSVKFDFYLDDVKVYSTGVLNYYSDAEYVCFDLKNAKKLRIVVGDAGNGKTSDHAVIAGMNLITNNASPQLNIPKDISVEVNGKIDLSTGYSAKDAEDGELTAKVTVLGSVDTKKAGNYKIIYSVADTDGNYVSKIRNVSVCDFTEYTQLAADDSRKITASNGYGSMGINLSTGGNELRLTKSDGNIATYTSGLGVHANSTVVYDISSGDYDFFTVDAGVDRESYGNANTSVRMYVYCDDEMRYDSGVITSKIPMEHIKVSVKGVSKIKLVVSDCGSNANDHADWCDMRLYTTGSTGDELTVLPLTSSLGKNEATEVGKKITFFANAFGGSSEYKYSFVVVNKDTGVKFRLTDFSADNYFVWTAGSVGNREFYVEVKDKTGTVKQSDVLNVNVVGNVTITAKADAAKVKPGEKVSITGNAANGSGSYVYSYLVHNTDTGSWYRLTDFVKSNIFEWTAGSDGNREFFVEAKDVNTLKIARSSAIKISVESANVLKINGTADKYEAAIGSKIILTGKASGGSGAYLYGYLVHNIDTGEWYRMTEFTSQSTYTWTASSAGNREFFIEVKDKNTLKVVRSQAIKIAVNNANVLSVTATVANKIYQVGDTISFNAKASGGSGTYTYSYLVQNIDTGEWYRFTGFTSNDTFVWNAAGKGNRNFFIEVKDSKGEVVRSKAININIK